MNNNLGVFVIFRSKKCHFYHWDWILKIAVVSEIGISSKDPFLDSDSFLTFQAGCDACFWYCCVCLHSKKFKVFIVITEKLAWVGCTFPKKNQSKARLPQEIAPRLFSFPYSSVPTNFCYKTHLRLIIRLTSAIRRSKRNKSAFQRFVSWGSLVCNPLSQF